MCDAGDDRDDGDGQRGTANLLPLGEGGGALSPSPWLPRRRGAPSSIVTIVTGVTENSVELRLGERSDEVMTRSVATVNVAKGFPPTRVRARATAPVHLNPNDMVSAKLSERALTMNSRLPNGGSDRVGTGFERIRSPVVARRVTAVTCRNPHIIVPGTLPYFNFARQMNAAG